MRSVSDKEQARIDFILELNKVLDDYLAISSEAESHFISDTELVFKNENNMVMCYDLLKKAEVFNLTQCATPNSRAEVQLKGMIKMNQEKR
mmetsp:Transcript_39516/g.29188  ORF Transcript_39516/g.29188 Transcript_39516/m.29188 type:complete len:91 (-) Transcript_39516:2500-2772(-)